MSQCHHKDTKLQWDWQPFDQRKTLTPNFAADYCSTRLGFPTLAPATCLDGLRFGIKMQASCGDGASAWGVARFYHGFETLAGCYPHLDAAVIIAANQDWFGSFRSASDNSVSAWRRGYLRVREGGTSQRGH